MQFLTTSNIVELSKVEVASLTIGLLIWCLKAGLRKHRLVRVEGTLQVWIFESRIFWLLLVLGFLRNFCSMICTFYQKGVCAYGSRCRYDHIKVSRSQPPASSFGPLDPPSRPAWGENSMRHDIIHNDDDFADVGNFDPADRPICSFAAAGECPRGVNCPQIHGDLCPTCRKHCLHPFRPEEREEHLKTCDKRQKHLEALKHSQEIECSVCLERVLSKPTAAERKFGILSECNHPFCVSCIRNWRSSSPASSSDANSALRTCPICRKLSYFVIPSVIWYSSEEEKQEIVDSYKAKLRSIDCKHFNFGNGTCPFGTSCFYKVEMIHHRV
ncbi:UNVERIFIED_CONTAM: E3 ubiquitin-protein ligase makorin [Sesamum radiatum]|uniref:E3 ubiquitin-protein ligase makorin n=1 Tax=Sesamum radiatum TaxID=300843 RepID=A0AAW2R2M4_SESRA